MGIENIVSGKFDKDILVHFASFLSGYCLLISFCWMLGACASQLLQNKKFVLQVFLEALAAFQVIVGASEGAGIGSKYGVQAWCLYTIFRVVLQNYVFHGATADPVMVLLDRTTSAIEKSIIISVQVLSGFLAMQCIPYLWQLSSSSLHLYRLTTLYDECQCDLKASIVQAFVIQLFYIFSIYVAEYIVPQLGKVFTVTTFYILLAVPGIETFVNFHNFMLKICIYGVDFKLLFERGDERKQDIPSGYPRHIFRLPIFWRFLKRWKRFFRKKHSFLIIFSNFSNLKIFWFSA